MKIRNRITLWITGAGLLAGLLFSILIGLELIEQPYAVLDRELDTQARALVAGLVAAGDNPATPVVATMLDTLSRQYWVRITDKQGRPVFNSAMTPFVDLPLDGSCNRCTVSAMARPPVVSGPAREMTFRLRVFTLPEGDPRFVVRIGRSTVKLEEEIVDLLLGVAAGLVFYTLVLLLFGYYAAGKILQPLAEINALTREISEKTLDRRIPLGRNFDELQALAVSLNTMFDRLQFSFMRQKSLLADASHELKTPLAMLRLFFSDALQRSDLPADLREQLTGQAAILLRMDRLVRNLLDLSALELEERGGWQKVDLGRICEEVLAEFADILKVSGIRPQLQPGEGMLLEGDADQLRRMCINLIDNALKYNQKTGGEIRISLQRQGEEIGLEIANTGPGVPEAELALVFNQFYRLEKSRSTALGGSGLGLTIVRRIVALHHGRVTMESDPGGWTRVQVWLPAARGPGNGLFVDRE